MRKGIERTGYKKEKARAMVNVDEETVYELKLWKSKYPHIFHFIASNQGEGKGIT